VAIGNQYVYQIAAVDSLGNESDLSNADTALVRDYTPPRVVRNVRVREVEEGIEISWEPVPSDDLVGYQVYRSNMPTGIYEAVNNQPVDTTDFIHQSPQEHWWYYVRAMDNSGNLSKPSDPTQAPESD
jgi:fibronectin type 3 domain-containing protein